MGCEDVAILCVLDALGGAVDRLLGGLAAIASDDGARGLEGGRGDHLRYGSHGQVE